MRYRYMNMRLLEVYAKRILIMQIEIAESCMWEKPLGVESCRELKILLLFRSTLKKEDLY